MQIIYPVDTCRFYKYRLFLKTLKLKFHFLKQIQIHIPEKVNKFRITLLFYRIILYALVEKGKIKLQHKKWGVEEGI